MVYYGNPLENNRAAPAPRGAQARSQWDLKFKNLWIQIETLRKRFDLLNQTMDRLIKCLKEAKILNENFENLAGEMDLAQSLANETENQIYGTKKEKQPVNGKARATQKNNNQTTTKPARAGKSVSTSQKPKSASRSAVNPKSLKSPTRNSLLGPFLNRHPIFPPLHTFFKKGPKKSPKSPSFNKSEHTKKIERTSKTKVENQDSNEEKESSSQKGMHISQNDSEESASYNDLDLKFKEKSKRYFPEYDEEETEPDYSDRYRTRRLLRRPQKRRHVGYSPESFLPTPPDSPVFRDPYNYSSGEMAERLSSATQPRSRTMGPNPDAFPSRGYTRSSFSPEFPKEFKKLMTIPPLSELPTFNPINFSAAASSAHYPSYYPNPFSFSQKP